MTRRWLVSPSSASSAAARAASGARRVGAGDEHERRRRRIGEHRDRGLVDRSLTLEAGERAEARGLLGVGEVVRPGGWQRQQPQRVAGRRGVEHDVVVALGGGRVGEQTGERVERGDLDGARAGELLLERGQLGRRHRGAVRADDSFAVGVGCGLRVEIHQVEPHDIGAGAGLSPVAVWNTSARLEAGSVLTSSTRRPTSASATGTALATVVLPTPPLPVNSTNRVCQSPTRAAEGRVAVTAHPRRAACSQPGDRCRMVESGVRTCAIAESRLDVLTGVEVLTRCGVAGGACSATDSPPAGQSPRAAWAAWQVPQRMTRAAGSTRSTRMMVRCG